MRKLLFLALSLMGVGNFALTAQAQAPFLPAAADTRCRQWVDSVLSRMSLRERVGQMLILTLPAKANAKQENTLRTAIRNYHIGGLLFRQGTAEEQAILTNMGQAETKVPLMITFDGEWGPAMRLKDMADFPMNASLGCIEGDSLIYEYGREVARELRELGVHVNFAPDADVNINPQNPVINKRSFGSDPVRVSAKVAAYGRGLEAGGMLSVSKHFPGHGDTDVDSHLALPVLPFSRARLDSIELYPFRRAVQAGLGGIMVGHLQVPALEPDGKTPSSLSHRIVTGLLKEELGFTGLIFTDAMEMKGVSSVPQATTRAIVAGNDMVLASDNLRRTTDELLQAVRSGTLSHAVVNERCRKILTYKYLLGLHRRPAPLHVSGMSYRMNTDKAQTLAATLRHEAVAVINNGIGEFPLTSYRNTPLAVLSLGEGQDSLFVAALRKETEVKQYLLAPADSTETMLHTLADQLSYYRHVVVTVSGRDVDAATYAARLSRLQLPVPAVYVFFVSYRGMQSLHASLQQAGAVILAHSGEPDLQQYAADILRGKTTARGRISMRF
ncbi:MAG: glycoside hydrolase family 3 protein [Mediterranea sp.]|jgi:beta-glucosidase-like glycosyl hydrolase|nr:glycoside hydrolase family 3 protein [Mediterranea sp.]